MKRRSGSIGGVGLGLGVGLAIVLTAASAGASHRTTLKVSSPVLTAHKTIPREFTCDGRSISPPLTWSAVPPRTESIAILVDDRDARGGTFEHFVAYNLAPTERSLPSEPAQGIVSTTPAVVLRNSGGAPGFAPICPPFGRHHYRFQVLALDTPLSLPPDAGTREIAKATDGHILARGQLRAVYRRTLPTPAELPPC